MSIRTERVASLIKEEIGAILQRDYTSKEYGFMTVTDVKMTADLKIARVYVSVLGSNEQQGKAMQMLKDEKRHLRGAVSSRVNLKFAPALEFYQDTTAEEVERLEKLLKKIHGSDTGSA